MNIVFPFCAPLLGKSAAGVNTMHTCHALAQKGINVYVLCSDPASSTSDIHAHYALEQLESLKFIRARQKVLIIKSNKIMNRSALKKIRDLAQTTPIDGIYCRFPKRAEFLLRKLPKIPLIYEAHFFYGDLAAERYGQRDRKVDALERSVWKKAAGIVCVSNPLRAAIAKTVPGKTLLTTVPNGAKLCKEAAGKDLRGDPEIIYSGDFSRQKGVQVLIAALQYLEGPKLTLIGGARHGHMDEMKNYAQRLGVSGVNFTGWLEHQAVQRHISRTQIGVLPYTSALHARSYISPMKLFEYMAARLAIVASDLPPLREIVSDEEVLFVRPDDPEDLARGLQRLIKSPELRARLAQKAYERAKDFTWEKRAERLILFIEDVLANHRRN